MARFYVNAYGARGETTRTGTPNSGIVAHPRGWNVGVKVEGRAVGDADVFDIYATHGSSNGFGRLIGTVALNADGVPTFVPADS